MEKKFSKGQLLISGSCSDSIRIATENYDVVADVYDGWNSVDKQIDMDICVANAKLIAAAPEMLEALESFVYEIEKTRSDDNILEESYHLAKEAIKKATE